MAITMKIIAKVDKIKPVIDRTIKLVKCEGDYFYDKDGNKIDVYFQRKWEITDYIVCFNGKEILVSQLEENFNSKNSIQILFDSDNIDNLIIEYKTKDSVEAHIVLEILQEYLYNVFDKEIEF
jgi:hypothetical protein